MNFADPLGFSCASVVPLAEMISYGAHPDCRLIRAGNAATVTKRQEKSMTEECEIYDDIDVRTCDAW